MKQKIMVRQVNYPKILLETFIIHMRYCSFLNGDSITILFLKDNSENGRKRGYLNHLRHRF